MSISQTWRALGLVFDLPFSPLRETALAPFKGKDLSAIDGSYILPGNFLCFISGDIECFVVRILGDGLRSTLI